MEIQYPVWLWRCCTRYSTGLTSKT